jgi:hypothetical protein
MGLEMRARFYLLEDGLDFKECLSRMSYRE